MRSVAGGVVCAAVAGALLAAQDAPPQRPPTFRTGTNAIRVDVSVIDRLGNTVSSLTADDFEVLEDGRPQPISSFKFIHADGQPGDGLSLPIRSPQHAAAEAARDDVRVFLIFWDEYHIDEFPIANIARDGLTKAVLERFGPTDLVAIMDPLTPTDAIRFTRDRRELAEQIRKLRGRHRIYVPMRSGVEEEHARNARRPSDIEVFRAQVTVTAIDAAMKYLGALREGRKVLLLVTQFLGPVGRWTDVVSTLVRAANDSNTAIHVVDPRGLQMHRMSPLLESLGPETGGEAILLNDIPSLVDRAVKQVSGFYLLGYTKDTPDDGKFHSIKVRVKRPGVDVRARSGYWAPRAADVARAKAAAAASALPPPVASAFGALTPTAARHPADVWVGLGPMADGKTEVRVAWAARGSPADGRPVAHALNVIATSAADRVFEGTVDAHGTSFLAPAGPLELSIAVLDRLGETIDRDRRTLEIADVGAAPLTLTTPIVMRVRSAAEMRTIATAPRPAIHAGRDFERNDRLLLRVAAAGAAAANATLAAKLLDSRAATLTTLPVHSQPGGGYQIDLPLQTIARGEYALAITAASGGSQAEAVVAFRIVR